MNSSSLTLLRHSLLQQRPALSLLYQEWYMLIKQHLSPVDGAILELGSGGGFLKKEIPSVITSDVLEGINVDLTLDAKTVGSIFPCSLSNLVLINVFHHIDDSSAFLGSALNALKPGGRILMIEPSYNIWSSVVYSAFRHEPFCPHQNGWSFTSSDPLSDSNQAQSWIVLERDKNRFRELFPDLRVTNWQFMMPLSYVLTGGFSFNLRMPRGFIALVRRLEKSFLDKRFGIFAFIVIEHSARNP